MSPETTLEPAPANVDILPFGAELVAPMDAFSMQSLGGMTNRVITYQYDGMQRLTAADYVENGQAVRSYDFAYDVSGNRTSETVFDGLSTLTTVYSYNRANQITAMQRGADAARPFTYDGAGNLLNDGINGYVYDAANRLTSRYDGLTQTTTGFAYNGVGDLVRQTTGGAATSYLLDMNSTLTQLLGEFAPGSDTYYLLGMDIIGSQTNGAWGYFGYDGLGSVRGVFDMAGQYAALTSYAPYGSPFEQYNNPATLGFTGEQTVAGGLNYLRARYYNPAIGTFLSRDPFSGTTNNAMSRNGYSYVHGNPTNWTDPSGEIIAETILGIAAVVVIVAALVTLLQQHQLNMNNQTLVQTIQNVGNNIIQNVGSVCTDLGAGLGQLLGGPPPTNLDAPSLGGIIGGPAPVQTPPIQGGFSTPDPEIVSTVPPFDPPPVPTYQGGFDLMTPGIEIYSADYRAIYNRDRQLRGLAPIPAGYQVHHRVPQAYRNNPNFAGFGFDDPLNLRGVPSHDAVTAGTYPIDVHSQITEEWRQWRLAHPNATLAEVQGFADEIDQRYGQHYWEANDPPPNTNP